MTEVKKTLQEVVNIIVALNGCENCYDEDTAEFKPWEVVSMLEEYANPSRVEEIRARHNQTKVVAPKWEVPGRYAKTRFWTLRTYPDDIEVQTTISQRAPIYEVDTQEVFWVNLLDSPWSESQYVGWKYVISFPNSEFPGRYLVAEDKLFEKVVPE